MEIDILALIGALGGLEGIKWLIRRITNRRNNKRIDNAEADNAEAEADKRSIEAEHSLRDMYEETLSTLRKEYEERLRDMRKDYEERLRELRASNTELNARLLDIIKAGARKDDIIENKTIEIRKLNEARIKDTQRIASLEKCLHYYKAWFCKREFGKGGEYCDRREPAQNPPIKYSPIEDSQKQAL